MRNDSLIHEIASLCGVEVGSIGGFNLSTLELDAESVHESVVKYFRSTVPDVPVLAESFSSTDIFRLVGRSELHDQNYNYVPSCEIIKAGFVTIATDISGDALAADIIDGNVYLVSHEISWDEELDDAPYANRNKITEESLWLGLTIDEFFQTWLDELTEITTKEAEFKAIAAHDPKASDDSGNTMLIHLVRDGDLEGVQKEIDRGAELEHFSSEGRTALGESVVFGHTEVLDCLLAAGANPNLAAEKHRTPLMLAAMYSKPDCIRTLLNVGADKTAKDQDGNTAFDHICVIHGTPEIEELLKL